MQEQVRMYLNYCGSQKCLDKKTLKAYRIDLAQFGEYVSGMGAEDVMPETLEGYIAGLHEKFKPKTVKRKIASLKALFGYFVYKDMIKKNPFDKIQVKFRSPAVLPKTVPLHAVERFLSVIYEQIDAANTELKRKAAVRDAAVMELLFATGMRISELCSLPVQNVDLENGVILIFGKGSKERMLQIGSSEVMDILKKYEKLFDAQISSSGCFFVNRDGGPLSDQSVRRMINKYADMAGIGQHITPHMFRHTFATSLLENDVDIRYIQQMLGHSSITTTEIYTHVSTGKQQKILESKHPRKDFRLHKEGSV